MTAVIGWDLGGANLKLAHLAAGRLVQVAQIPCPIRQEASKFDAALEQGLLLCPSGATHAVTMTGELSDVFAGRAEGVAYLVEMMRRATGGEALFYGGQAGFLDCIRAVERSSRGRFGQLARERRAGQHDRARRSARRYGHHHHRPGAAE